mgnify:CR=1 FL=1
MVAVEGGTYYMGAQSDDPNGINYDEDAYLYVDGRYKEMIIRQMSDIENNFHHFKLVIWF